MDFKNQYQVARKFLKTKDYSQAQALYAELYQRMPDYKSVRYFYAKTLFLLKHKTQALRLLDEFLASRKETNRGPAFLLRAQIRFKQKHYELARQDLAQARNYGKQLQKIAKLHAKLPPRKKQPARGEYPRYVKIKLERYSSSQAPICRSQEPFFRGKYLILTHLTNAQKEQLASKQWLELYLNEPQEGQVKNYLTCQVLDDRDYYRKYLPQLKSWYQITRFNDYLEEDKYFHDKWARSKVFALLLTRIFSQAEIHQNLLQADLLSEVEEHHLVACLDLVKLKQSGESLPLSQADQIEDLDLLRDFGFICAQNCQNTIHLADKCHYERKILALLKAQSKMALPFKHPEKGLRPTREQLAFMKWLYAQKSRVVSLLGVGGSGKTVTLGKILDSDKVLALAPTHKARLNLSAHGFKHNQTIQSLLYQAENKQEFEPKQPYQVIVIDEVSMVTTEMLAKLVDFLGTDYRYLLVGDDQQLPPVSQDEDALTVCGNLMDFLKQKSATFYFQANLRCQNPATKDLIKQVRQKDIQALAHSTAFKEVNFQAMINAKSQKLSNEACLILAHTNRMVAEINRIFWEKLPAPNQEKTPFFIRGSYGRGGFFVGAQVVFYQNDDASQEYGYTNSEFGQVTKLSQEKYQIFVEVETSQRTYKLPLKRAEEDLLLAYGLTVHKAQGSGAEQVYITELSDFKLAYTAVSRSKNQLYFCGCDRQALLAAVNYQPHEKVNIY
ncbi:MAG: AAA family ATPase [Ligilactobacillus sp.]|nr:AAA family ATPase [Ligilactobacillus sp.]